MAKTRRTLLDLFSPGREVTFDDGLGAVTVWLQKISPAENELAVRKASASRARLRAVLSDHDTDEYLAMVDDVSGYGRDVLINYLVSEKEMEIRMSVEAELELGDDTEWGKDGYARGLVESWAGGLRERYEEEPEDPEVQRVLSEIQRYNEEVQARILPKTQHLRADYDDYPVERLRQEVVEKFIESRLSTAWVREFERCRVWKATRHPDNHRKYYFEHREQVEDVDDEILTGLIKAYDAISVEGSEGKGSPENPASSTSSETPEPEPEASGPDGAPLSTTSPTS